MHAAVKALWTAALRSGEYQQAQGYLRTDEGHCCLGVLCEVAVKNGVIPEPKRIGSMTDEPVYMYGTDQSYLTLPEAVREWAGLDEYNPLTQMDSESINLDGLPYKAPLSELNDSRGFDFPKIADVIDAEF